jgi:hypothetical protein
MSYSPFLTDFPDLEKADAHIYVIFKGGKFLDAETKKELQLSYDPKLFPEGIHLKLLVPVFALDKESQNIHSEQKKAILIERDALLNFEIEDYTFYCKLNTNLYLQQKGKRTPFLSKVKCEIIEIINSRGNNISPLVIKSYESLNQAFTGSSIAYFPGKKYHTGNVFKKFQTDKGEKLENLRSKIEANVFEKK